MLPDKTEIIDLTGLDDGEMQKLGLEEVPEHLSFSVCRKNFTAVVHPAATGDAEPLEESDIAERRESYLDDRADDHWSKEEEAGVSDYAKRLGEAWRSEEWEYTHRGQCRWDSCGQMRVNATGTCARPLTHVNSAVVQALLTLMSMCPSTPEISISMARADTQIGCWPLWLQCFCTGGHSAL